MTCIDWLMALRELPCFRAQGRNWLGEMLVRVKPNDPGVPFLTLLPSGWPTPSTTPQQLLNLLAMPRPDKPMDMIWLLLPLLAGHLDKADSRARLYSRWCKQTQSIRALYSVQLHQPLAELGGRDTVPAAWLEEICKCLSGSVGLAADEAQDWPLLRQLVQAFKEGDDHTIKGWSKAWQKVGRLHMGCGNASTSKNRADFVPMYLLAEPRWQQAAARRQQGWQQPQQGWQQPQQGAAGLPHLPKCWQQLRSSR